MKALVVGATGRVGRLLCGELSDSGHEVVALSRRRDAWERSGLESRGIEWIGFDITTDDPGQLPEVDAVFLEVWDRERTSDQDAEHLWRLNLDGVGRVVQHYAGRARIINGSTGSLYGPRPDRPSRERDLPFPDSQYALSRLCQEKLINFLCESAGSAVLHLRYFHSNDENQGGLRRMADTILKERSLGANPDQRVQMIGLKDFVRCTALGLEHARTPARVINVCHPQTWTMRELAGRLQERLGRGEVRFDSNEGGETASVWGNTERMIETFGPPREDLNELIDRVCASALADRAGKTGRNSTDP